MPKIKPVRVWGIYNANDCLLSVKLFADSVRKKLEHYEVDGSIAGFYTQAMELRPIVKVRRKK